MLVGAALQVRDVAKGRPGYPGKLAVTCRFRFIDAAGFALSRGR